MILSMLERLPSYAIIQKELILRIRRVRSLLIQLAFAGIVGASMWISVVLGSQENSPEDHALLLVTIYFTVQVVVLGLIVPTLGAVSITSEKQEKTWESLVTTDLTPGQVVSGKMIGIVGVLFYLLLLPAPILSMTMLFGGVSLGSIAFEYLIHFLGSILIVSLGILSSAASKGTVRSILQCALATIPLIFMVLAFLWNEVYYRDMLLLDYIEKYPPPWQFWIWSITIYLGLGLGSLMKASYLLSGAESSRDIPVRLLTFVLAGFFFGILVVTLGLELQSSIVGNGGRVLMCILLLYPLTLTRIAGSSAKVPLRIVQMHAHRRWGTTVGAIFLPGGIRNLLYSCLLLSFSMAAMMLLLLYDPATPIGGMTTNTMVNALNSTEMFLMWQGMMFLWGVAVLTLSWFFAQCGFSGMVASALAIGIQIALALVSLTARELNWSNAQSFLENFSPPMHLLNGLIPFPEIDMDLWYQANLSMGGSILVLMIFGVWIARIRKNPVWEIKRPGLDRLYFDIPAKVE